MALPSAAAPGEDPKGGGVMTTAMTENPATITAAGTVAHAARLRGVLEMFREAVVFECDALEDVETLRKITRSLKVPYLFLLLDLYLDRNPSKVRVEDIAEWNADPVAQTVFAQWIAEGVAPDEKAVA